MSCYIGVCDGYNLDGTKRTRSRTLKKPLGMSDAKFQKLVQEETLKKERKHAISGNAETTCFFGCYRG